MKENTKYRPIYTSFGSIAHVVLRFRSGLDLDEINLSDTDVYFDYNYRSGYQPLWPALKTRKAPGASGLIRILKGWFCKPEIQPRNFKIFPHEVT